MSDRYRTTSEALARAKRLRRDMTEAEKKLWYRIRAGQLEGHQFRKQVPLDPYILDFACLRKWLAVEVERQPARGDFGKRGNKESLSAARGFLRREVLEQ